MLVRLLLFYLIHPRLQQALGTVLAISISLTLALYNTLISPGNQLISCGTITAKIRKGLLGKCV